MEPSPQRLDLRGQFMFSKRAKEKIMGSALFAALPLFIVGYQVYVGEFVVHRAVGFFFGLFGGFISVCVAVVRSSRKEKTRLLRSAELIFSPLAALLFLPFSAVAGGGYFLGSTVTFLFGWSLVTLHANLKSKDK